MAMLRINNRRIGIGLFVSAVMFWYVFFPKENSAKPANTLALSQKLMKGAPAAGANAFANAEKSSKKVKAAFVTLARNEDLEGLTGSIKLVEDRFNKQFKYDWIFLNEVPFTQEFKKTVTKMISGRVKFGLIPKEHWSYPDWIDLEKAAKCRKELDKKNVLYAMSESYRHMCRFESGFFFRHNLLANYEYYWRVEPEIKILCDIDYDVFQYMKDNDKWYGWTVSLPEYKETIPTLWETTKKFMAEYPQHVAEDNNMKWITYDDGETYNGCHFWSNFEIGALKFWRSEAYLEYFDYLDKSGGFFYERWGDAPVHSIAASLFMPRDKIHFFQDIGYFHAPITSCPINEQLRAGKNCACEPTDDFTWKRHSCTPRFFSVNLLARPQGWEKFAA